MYLTFVYLILICGHCLSINVLIKSFHTNQTLNVSLENLIRRLRNYVCSQQHTLVTGRL